jgi:CRISPR-associated protein Cas2
MRGRIMRNIIFFDLPNVKYRDRVNYQKFRKFSINEGFIMMQESIYSKFCLNPTQNEMLCQRIRKNAPQKGLIQMMIVTEKQYSNIEYIIGEPQEYIVDNSDRMVII